MTYVSEGSALKCLCFTDLVIDQHIGEYLDRPFLGFFSVFGLEASYRITPIDIDTGPVVW